MPVIEIPLTTYSVRENKPNQKFGSTAVLPIEVNESRIYARVPLDKIPVGATITSAILRFYKNRDVSGSRKVRVFPVTGSWNASVTWATQPSIGSLITSVTDTNPASWDLDVTTWAQTRSRKGVRVDTDGAKHFLNGSAAASGKPVLEVSYTVPPETPASLQPNGGSVSTARPILIFAGDEDMSSFRVDFSTDGSTVSATTGFITSTTPYFDDSQAPGIQPELVDGGSGIWWRVVTNGPSGMSDPSDWAYYDYVSLPVVTFTNPGSTTEDGSPTAQWTVSDQDAYKVDFYNTDTGALIETSGWVSSSVDNAWTPSRGVKVPDGHGRFRVLIQDTVVRVAAFNAPIRAEAILDFTTILSSSGTAVDSLTLVEDGPIPRLEGVRSAGIPDEVALSRDGVLVPLWDPVDGNVYNTWTPAASFFTGTSFSIPDYTADPRHQHTWKVLVRVNGAVSSDGPEVSDTHYTNCVWLVNPRTGDWVEILGDGNVPTVSQSTSEESIVHTPINGGLIVEPKRRRLVRTLRFGSITGAVLDEDEKILDEWVEGDSSDKYRLIFGKVNWPVIIGNYSPSDIFYPGPCGPNSVLIALDWWQRRSEV